jgi:hypothetical protein
MKNIIMVLLFFSLLLTSSVTAAPVGPSPEFSSAVETYVMVEFMVVKHMSQEMLAYKLLHAMSFGASVQEVYDMIPAETGGVIPDIFEPYYP